MNKIYAYKTFSAIAICLAFFVLGACHKNKPNPIPGPAPIFDSTAYKDSVVHALHLQDSIQHYNDSLIYHQDSVHYHDSLLTYYINKTIGIRFCGGQRHYWWPMSDTVYAIIDTVTIARDTNNSIALSDSRMFMNLQELRPLHCDLDTSTKIMKAKYYSNADLYCTLYYYYTKDSIYIEYRENYGHLGGNYVYLHTN